MTPSARGCATWTAPGSSSRARASAASARRGASRCCGVCCPYSAAVSERPQLREAADSQSFRVRNVHAAKGTFDAAPKPMTEVLVDYENTIAGADGSRWAARACGRRGAINMWEGWIEFVPLDLDRKPIRSTRETTQPSREDLLYWATGLTPVYLRGALTRALEAPLTRPTPRRVRPHFEGPAPSIVEPPQSPRAHAILDPFDVYAQGEDILIAQLDALRSEEHTSELQS